MPVMLTEKEFREFRKEHGFVEATRPVSFSVTEADIQQGVPFDGVCCALARAASRAFAGNYVWIGRKYAYIEHPDNSGVNRLHRYSVSPKARNYVLANDKLGDKQPPGVVTFRPPCEADTVRACMARAKEGRERGYKAPKPKTRRDGVVMAHMQRVSGLWKGSERVLAAADCRSPSQPSAASPT